MANEIDGALWVYADLDAKAVRISVLVPNKPPVVIATLARRELVEGLIKNLQTARNTIWTMSQEAKDGNSG